MRIDAHQHYWQYNTSDYPWMSDAQSILKQDYLPAHLEPGFIENGFHGGIAVQARQLEAETEYLLHLQDQSRFILGVVGWTDLTADGVANSLARFQGRVLGFRHQLEDEPAAFMLQESFRRGIGQLDQYGYSYDLLIRPDQYDACLTLVDEFPHQRFVLDHLGKPDYQPDSLVDWSSQVRQLAARDNVWCKLSGMVSERSPVGEFEEELALDVYVPFLDCVLEAFTPARLMFGSDWPVCTLAATYDEVYDIVDVYTQKLTTSERARIMGDSAAEFYRLPGSPPTQTGA